MQFCDKILPPDTRHLFLNLKWWWAGATCFEADWPNYRPSTGGVSSPGGSSIPSRDQHAQGEQLAQGEKHSKGGAACPGRAATKTQLQQYLSVKSKIIFCLALNLKIKFKCLVLYIINVRFRLMRAPGITHELCSYPAVLRLHSFLAFRTSTALSQRPSQWFNTRTWPRTKYVYVYRMCLIFLLRFGWRINKDYSILFYSYHWYSESLLPPY